MSSDPEPERPESGISTALALLPTESSDVAESQAQADRVTQSRLYYKLDPESGYLVSFLQFVTKHWLYFPPDAIIHMWRNAEEATEGQRRAVVAAAAVIQTPEIFKRIREFEGNGPPIYEVCLQYAKKYKGERREATWHPHTTVYGLDWHALNASDKIDKYMVAVVDGRRLGRCP